MAFIKFLGQPRYFYELQSNAKRRLNKSKKDKSNTVFVAEKNLLPHHSAAGDDFKPKFELHGATEHFGFNDRRPFVPVDFLDLAREVHHRTAGDEHFPALDVAFGEPRAQVPVRDAFEKLDFGIAERFEISDVFEDAVECDETAQTGAHGGGVALEDEVPRKHGADLFVPRAAVALEALNGEQHNLHWDPGEGKAAGVRRFAFLSGGDL